MGQILRFGFVIALVVAVGGCGSTGWLGSLRGEKETASDPGKAEGQVSLGSDQVGGQPAAGPANSSMPGRLDMVHVLFGFDRWDLNGSAQAGLLSLVKKLKENPKLTAELQGYADSAGARDYNLWLSQKRVETVRRFLVDKGVEAARIRSASLGQLSDGGTPEERAKNRRVTVKLAAGSN